MFYCLLQVNRASTARWTSRWSRAVGVEPSWNKITPWTAIASASAILLLVLFALQFVYPYHTLCLAQRSAAAPCPAASVRPVASASASGLLA